ncbi:MAG: AMP-dependent synthetase [Desulfobacterales bacterium]|nr:MAG: AMP-dependent synthetase [Desulfobacterales bacterium]
MGLQDLTFYDLICQNAGLYAKQDAWYEADSGNTLRFSEYKVRVDQLSAGLQKIGVQKGDRIGVLGKNSLSYFLLYGAAAAIGAIMLPINWRLSADEVIFNVNDGTPVTLFMDPEYRPLISENKTQLPSVKSIFELHPNHGHTEYAAIDSLMENDGNFTRPKVKSQDGFVIIHTAAVSGRPRGALLSHENALLAGLHLMHQLNLSSQDVHLNLLPLFHVAGLFMATSSFQAGALNVNMIKFDAQQAVELIAEKNISLLFDFSPILSTLLETQEETGTDISSLRSVIGIESPETIKAYQRRTGGCFHCIYGQTETSALTTLGRYDDRPGSAGRPVALSRVAIFDDTDTPVAAGEMGEIVMQGPLVFKGYWGLDEENKETFRNGWHHTGDLGCLDEAGFLWFKGRKPDKELIKPGGENVYPAEVEKVICEHNAIAAAVVFGVPDPKWKEAVCAVCLLKPGQTLSEKAIIEFVGERIARYKKPRFVTFTDQMPLMKDSTPNRLEIKKRYKDHFISRITA